MQNKQNENETAQLPTNPNDMTNFENAHRVASEMKNNANAAAYLDELVKGDDEDSEKAVAALRETPKTGGFDPDSQRRWAQQMFKYDHLSPELQAISRPFGELAAQILDLPSNVERSVALRKLLESKDAAVRALILK